MKLFLTAILAYLLNLNHMTPIALAKGPKGDKSSTKKTKPTQSYRRCRKITIKNAKKIKNKTKQIRAMKKGVLDCREKHPSAAILTKCRKDALKRYAKRDKEYLPVALKNCKKKYKSFQFSHKKPLPFRVTGQEFYFASYGLNRTLELKQNKNKQLKLEIPNFDCKNIEDILTQKATPQYLLYGNDPRSFLPLKQTPQKQILEKLAIKSNQESPIRINEHLGQVFWKKSSKSLTNYFPSGFCTYSAKTNGFYENLKIYYLLDIIEKKAVPYFGIAFYKESKAPKAHKLKKIALKALGEDYADHSFAKNNISLSKAAFRSFDHEGDPRNLCNHPRNHDAIVNIATDKSGKKASYLLLSRVSNLCLHGDKLADRLLRSSKK